MVSDFQPTVKTRLNGMDEALTEAILKKTLYHKWGTRAHVLFLNDVWGGQCQLLRSVLYMIICLLLYRTGRAAL